VARHRSIHTLRRELEALRDTEADHAGSGPEIDVSADGPQALTDAERESVENANDVELPTAIAADRGEQ
jgi:hypothetical protein